MLIVLRITVPFKQLNLNMGLDLLKTEILRYLTNDYKTYIYSYNRMCVR